MSNMSFELPIGVKYQDQIEKSVSLMKVNGYAEKMFTDKNPKKPYTWMGTLLSGAINKLGPVALAKEARDEYAESDEVTLHHIIKSMTLADVNTCLVEIHRRLWEDIIPNQECMCKYCGERFKETVDLNKINFFEEDLVALEAGASDFQSIVVKLKDGLVWKAPKSPDGKGKGLFEEFNGVNFDTFEFRSPTLGDAIRSEKNHKDDIVFWRRIAFDCLTKVTSSEDNVELSPEAYRSLGLKLYNELLGGRDLKKIRKSLRETLPTLPFYYETVCHNKTCKELTPISVEGNAFFSE